MSHVAINRYHTYFSSKGKFLDPFLASLRSYIKTHGGDIQEILAEKRKDSSFRQVGYTLKAAYRDDRYGFSDPTDGALFFIHATKSNISPQDFNSTVEARAALIQWTNEMVMGYTNPMADAQGQAYPFTYKASPVYYVEELGFEMFLYVGNHVCIASASCGKGFLSTQPLY